ncbi:glycosyltransferase [Calothrix rhizosoleniae]|uniref:glycosyltransferase n=1 Tax=Calothrix rhizosoleniae TaxID=888997 RepID=UPI001356386D|nr:glycosyltransferase [Calothrix rhizosoleniae]
MRILDLCEFYSERGGGVRSYLTKMLGAASKRGHELIVVAPGTKEEVVEENGGRIIRYPGPPMPYDPTYHAPLRLDRMRDLVLEAKPDVLQVSSPFLPALAAATIKNIPLQTYIYHSDPIYIIPIPSTPMYDPLLTAT